MQTSARLEERWLFTIDVPDSLVEELRPLPRGWDSEPASVASRTVGDQWVESQRSVALLVPSSVVPVENNALINPRHPLFKLAWVKKPTRFRYDRRLQ
jgi:RES domain-containing protein